MASGLTQETKEQAAELREGAAGREDGARAEKETVFVWPHLVKIEMIGMLLYVLLFSLMAIFVNAPLRNLANPEVTPNPAKAPWYFLGLQELLLHMNPALAGVIVPTAVLIGLAAIPYIDTRRAGTGIYFSTRKGRMIAIFSFVYTAVWNIGLILIDEFLVLPGMAEGARGIGPALKTFAGAPPWITDWAVPIFFMLLIPALLVLIVKRVWQANTREVMIALFSFFVSSFIVLTAIGTAFRGHSMRLVWPWEVGHPEEMLQ